MTYAAEHITSHDDGVVLMVGVDTCVFHGFVKCGAVGAITGIGNVLPKETLHFVALAKAAAEGDMDARLRARELSEAIEVLSLYDEGTDLVLYYKYLMVLEGNPEYALHFNPTDELSPSQRAHAESQLRQFKAWYSAWSRQPGAVETYRV
jgi:Dihydrodipicolinate synthase/N-acetylneuraminate lyase